MLNYIAWVNRSPNRIAENAQFVEAALAGAMENNISYNPEVSISQSIGQLSLRATQPFEARI